MSKSTSRFRKVDEYAQEKDWPKSSRLSLSHAPSLSLTFSERTMIKIHLPSHLRVLAQVPPEIQLDVPAPVTQRAILDALESKYPMLRGTIRDHVTFKRRPMLRFF